MRLRLVVHTAWLVGAVALIAVGLGTGRAPAADASSDVSRGQYLTGPAGQCADCHGAGLAGAPIPFTVPNLPPNVPFANAAPNLKGLTMFANDQDAVKFFTTGLLQNGQRARPPMPQYRFNDADAHAIVAYLRSLKS